MTWNGGLAIIWSVAGCLLITPCLAAAETIGSVPRPETGRKNAFYVGNREPLLPGPLLKLPIGAIEPRAGTFRLDGREHLRGVQVAQSDVTAYRALLPQGGVR